VTVPPNTILDDVPGQAQSDVRFELVSQSLISIGTLHTLSASGISASTQGAVKRTLSGVVISQAELNDINPFTDRVRPWWQLGDGSQWPLGVYCFAAMPRRVSSFVDTLAATMLDQGFLLDQENEQTVSIPARGLIIDMVESLLDSSAIPIDMRTLPSNSDTKVFEPIAWPAVTHKTAILDECSQMGGWLPHYFDNNGRFVLRAPPNIEYQAPDIIYPIEGSTMAAGSVVENDNLLDAPNVYRVVGSGVAGGEIVGVARVNADLPYSVENRKFIVPKTVEMQGLSSNNQAQQMAEQLAASAPGFQEVSFEAIADPRHDLFMLVGYGPNTYREVGFDLKFGPGGPMTHNLTQGGFPNAG
jgi:hypothetical protein